MNFINDTTLKLYNSLLNDEKMYMKVNLNSKLIGIAS